MLNGAFKHDTKRARPIGPKAHGVLGDPPPILTAAECACWSELAENAPAGVLTSGDRLQVELVARLLARFRADWLSGQEMAQLTGGLARMGMTPADRKRVSTPTESPDSAGDEFK